ncbi:MAG: TetR/AcrR family transcriptional regulator [Gammaproteobacteria bacterium]|nr:TetR/AcrR family transcriptional regulator [Gammaproteobacteria bacterium]
MARASKSDIQVKRTHKQRRADSDTRILAAAIKLFSQHGYQKTTLIQIGAEAGYTGTLISNRFGSKEQLLRAVLAHILRRFEENENANQRPGLSATEQLRSFITEYLHDAVSQESRIRALYVIMGEALGSITGIEDEIIKVNRVFRAHVEQFVAEGVETGEFLPDLDPEMEAVIIVGE